MPLERSLLASLPLFADFAPQALNEVLAHARSRRFAKNTPVFEQGAEASSFFLLLHGRVRAYKGTPAGDQIVMRFVGPGEFFGVAPAFGGRIYPANAIAIVDAFPFSGPRHCGPSWRRGIPSWPAACCGPWVAGFRTYRRGSPRCRHRRSSEESPTRCFVWRRKAAGRKRTGLRSTFRSRAKTSRR